MRRQVITTGKVWATIEKLFQLEGRNIHKLTIIIESPSTRPVKLIAEETVHTKSDAA